MCIAPQSPKRAMGWRVRSDTEHLLCAMHLAGCFRNVFSVTPRSRRYDLYFIDEEVETWNLSNFSPSQPSDVESGTRHQARLKAAVLIPLVFQR